MSVNFSKTYLNEDEYINGCEKTKYLGVVIDKHLKWSEHINYFVTKLRKLVYKFYTLREILPEKLSILVYKSLVESLLHYGIVAWGGTYKTNLKPLQTIQNYILKIIYKKKQYPTLDPTNQIYNCNIFNIQQLYIW